MTKEIYKRYRPTDLAEVVGQEKLCTTLENLLERKRLPHTLLFTGPSGCGKTTIARILRERLGCGDADFKESNGSEARGIDDMRKLKRLLPIAPMDGKCRVWLIDECQGLSNDAQQMLLKPLEDTPRHVYFFLATTHPQKILPTIKSRAMLCELKPIELDVLEAMVARIAEAEDISGGDGLWKKIAQAADGSARRALVILEKVSTKNTAAEKMEAIDAVDAEGQAIMICRALFAPKKPTWREVAAILRTVTEEPEAIRRQILGYARAVLLNKGDRYSAAIIEEFSRNYYDNGAAGLAASCYAVIQGNWVADM